jgi:SAM-dependent methyltransferase
MKAMHTPATHSAPFDALAESYDAWYDAPDGRRLFSEEVTGLRDLLEEAPRPWLEVGVGTGRFAEALHIDEGIEPSETMRRLAANRGVTVRAGRAEALPYDSDSFGEVLLVMSLCFLDDPNAALRECRRILRRDGVLIVGIVPRESPLGRRYAEKAAAGHPFYSKATFYTPRDVRRLAERAGFAFVRAVSCLLEPPGEAPPPASAPRDGILPGAGFVAMSFAPSPMAAEEFSACEAGDRETAHEMNGTGICAHTQRQGSPPC